MRFAAGCIKCWRTDKFVNNRTHGDAPRSCSQSKRLNEQEILKCTEANAKWQAHPKRPRHSERDRDGKERQ
jgi:hypothetical protein